MTVYSNATHTTIMESDVWILPNSITVQHADCRSALKSYQDGMFGAIITDPPETIHGGWGVLAWLKEHDLWRLLADDGIAIVFTNPTHGHVRVPKADPMQAWTEIDDSFAPRAEHGHLHARPLEAVSTVIEQTHGLILDPYMGSGTTLLAARQAGRACVGIDNALKCCLIAVGRLREAL